MSRGEYRPLSTEAAAGAGASSSAFSVMGFFSHLKDEWDCYHFDIHEVCLRGDYAALKEFVATHRDPVLLRRMANCLNFINNSPLYEITLVGKVNITPAHCACAQLLLELGADPNFCKKDDSNDTLLRAMIVHSTVEAAALLIRYGASAVGLKGLDGKLLAITPAWAEKIAKAERLSATPLNFVAEFEAEEEHETHYSESKKER